MPGQRITNVAIVGCGKIGAEWDASAQDLRHGLTHAAAFSRNPESRLIAVCDRDPARAEAASLRWGRPRPYSDLREMLAGVPVDLLVIATSSSARWALIEQALSAGIKHFVIEKPVATSLAESAKIIAALEQAGARALVNFSRRWDPSMHELRSRIAAGGFGILQRLVGLYGKGIVNNGSHMLDLAAALCRADPIRVRALGSPLPSDESRWSDDGDRALDAQIIFADANGTEVQLDLLGTDQSAFTCFELKIIGRDAICNITAGGRKIEMMPITSDPNFPNYRIPGPAQDGCARSLESMDLMAAEAIGMVRGEIERASCDARSAMATAMAIDAVKHSAIDGGSWKDVNRQSDFGMQR